MSVTLFHHPFSRAATTIWMLEEVGIDYDMRFVDLMKGEHKTPELLALNPMGKLPILTDGEQVVTEGAAIGLYLADKYASGRLAPALDDPARGTYLRWSLFAPSVIEPGASAHGAGWDFKPQQAGWGSYEVMLDTMESAITGRDYILGETFSMADVIFGGTVRFMLRFDMIESRPAFVTYSQRLSDRPAAKKAAAINEAAMREHGIDPS
ncbi:MAG: glutathione S-transferase family protein [Nannocystaceae bacterium]|nr:glutathione S-transferase family protein [Nannocystaceae bacterium]